MLYSVLGSIVGIVSFYHLFKYIGKRSIALHTKDLEDLYQRILDMNEFDEQCRREYLEEIEEVLSSKKYI